MTETTEPTWPAERHPTPEEFRVWFLAQTEAGQLEIAAHVSEWSDTAMRCFIQNHDGLMRENSSLREHAHRWINRADRYRLAWASARRRASGGLA